MGVLHNGSAWGALNLMNFPSPSSTLGTPLILYMNDNGSINYIGSIVVYGAYVKRLDKPN